MAESESSIEPSNTELKELIIELKQKINDNRTMLEELKKQVQAQLG